MRIDLLHPGTLLRYRARPERLFDLVRAQSDGQVSVIDEVQRVPELLSAVHALIEGGSAPWTPSTRCRATPPSTP